MSRMQSKVLFSVSVVLGLLVGDVDEANALFRRESASQCFVDDASSSPSADWDTSGAGTGIKNESGATLYLSCPAQNDDRFQIQQVTTLNVHGYISSGTASVAACTAYWGSDGGACGTYSSTSTTGNYALSPALTYWTSTYYQDFPYISVILSPSTSPAYVTLRGYYMAS